MAIDILPDSRCTVRRGVMSSPQGNIVPIHCANCGREMGAVPEDAVTFAFALCDPCAEVYGDDAHFHKEPHAPFFEAVAEELRKAEITTESGLILALENPSSALSLLAKDWRALVRKET